MSINSSVKPAEQNGAPGRLSWWIVRPASQSAFASTSVPGMLHGLLPPIAGCGW